MNIALTENRAKSCARVQGVRLNGLPHGSRGTLAVVSCEKLKCPFNPLTIAAQVIGIYARKYIVQTYEICLYNRTETYYRDRCETLPSHTYLTCCTRVGYRKPYKHQK